MSRKRKNENEKFNRIINFGVNIAQEKELKDRATNADISISRYIRRILFPKINNKKRIE